MPFQDYVYTRKDYNAIGTDLQSEIVLLRTILDFKGIFFRLALV